MQLYPFRFKSLKSNMIFFGLMTSLAPLLIYQLITLEKSADLLESTYSAELNNKTDLTTLLISQSIAYNISELKTFAKALPFLTDRNNIAHYLQDIVDYRNDIKSVSIFAPTGRIEHSTSPSMKGRGTISNFPDDIGALFKQTLQGKTLDVFVSEAALLESDPSIFIFIKTEAVNNGKEKLLMMEMNFDNIALLLSNFEDEMDGYKHIYLVDRNHRILFTHDPVYSFFDPFRDYQAIIRSHLNDENKIQRHSDIHGDTMLVSISTMPEFGTNKSLGWNLVAFVPVELFTHKVISTLKTLVLIGVFIILLTVIMAYLMARSIIRPVKLMAKMANLLRSGDYTVRTESNDNDPTEIQTLTTTLNAMASKVENHTKELRAKNDYIYFILDASPVFMMTVDNGVVDYINRRFLSYLGYSDMEAFLNQHNSFCSLIHQINEEVVEGNEPSRIESLLQESKTQQVVYFKTRDASISSPFIASVICYESKKCIYTFTDITQIQMEKQELAEKVSAAEVERQKQQKIMELQSRQAQMGELIGSIAHQWKQPLNMLSLYLFDMTEMYKLEQLDDAYVDNFSKNLRDAITYMSNTIDDFRNYFQPSEEIATFDPREAIENILVMLGKFYSLQDIDIAINEKKKIALSGIKNEFQQVIVNILNNAKDAFIDNKIELREIAIDITEKGDNALIEITDNAGGIPETILPNIFDSYFSTKKEKEGTGIGLYMSKEIIEKKMHGKLTARNIEGGAVFTLTLPLAEATE